VQYLGNISYRVCVGKRVFGEEKEMHSAGAMDMVFPRACAGCGQAVGEEAGYLCWNCISRIRVIQRPFCDICGCPYEGSVENVFVCSYCSRKRPYFDMARSAVHYTGIVQKLVQDFKYHSATWLAGDLASLMIVCMKAHFPEFQVQVIAPVPLHPARRRERSYNQANLLAGRIAASLDRPAWANAIDRVRQTKSQTHLTAQERRANVIEVFSVGKANRFDGLNVLLVDDVMTTGATLNDCARALKADGARTVAALTVARG